MLNLACGNALLREWYDYIIYMLELLDDEFIPVANFNIFQHVQYCTSETWT